MQNHDLSTSRLTAAELSAQLDAELAKDPRDMDIALIDSLLARLEPDVPDQRQHERVWQRVIRGVRLHRCLRAIPRLSAVAAVLLLMVVCLQQSALAFDWQFLRSIFFPTQETFFLTSTVTDTLVSNAPVTTEGPLQFTWPSWEDIPAEIDGHPFKPEWMPPQFSYQWCTAFVDDYLTKADLGFTSETGHCTITLTIYSVLGDTTVAFEKEQETEDLRSVNGRMVRFYGNDDGYVHSAIWQQENTSTCVTGVMTEEELLHIVESLIR